MPVTEQQIRFCTSSDGVRVAFATVGDGPPLVKAANWLSHLEFDWNSPVWRHWILELARDHTLVRYDERGCGLSDWSAEEFSLDAWVRDLEAVVDGLGRSHRDLSEREREEREVMLRMIAVGWGKDHAAFRQVFTSLFIPEASQEQTHWFNELQRVSATPENALRIARTFDDLDVRELAPRLELPTLALHATGDLRVPFAEGRLLASLIPGARFVPLESRNHILLEGEPAWPRFIREVRSFLGVSTGEDRPGLAIGTARRQRIEELFDQAIELPPHDRPALAAGLFALGGFHLVRHRHFRWGGMRVGPRDLTIWSFLMASAHGAGLMALPLVLGAASHASAHGPGLAHHAGHLSMALAGLPEAQSFWLLASGVHTVGYLAATGLVAVVVYEKLGLRLLGTAWVNLDLVWSGALVVSAILTPLV